MFTKIELTQEDIIGIIADYFNVPPKDVSVVIEKEWKGYGPMEHYEHEVKIIITRK